MSELNKLSETTRFFIIASSLFWFFLFTYCLVYRYPTLNKNNNTNETNVSLIYNLTTQSNIFNSSTNSIIVITTDSTLPPVNLFNLSKGLKSSNLYKSISCEKTDLNLTLCDTIDQKTTKQPVDTRNNLIKKKIIDYFKDRLVNKSDHVVLDLGAREGKYGLIAAKLGRDVLLAEPFLPNILKIHKAAQLENLHDKMTLVRNKISNKRSFEYESNKIKNSKIVLDDLINYLPKDKFNQSYKNAIVKIDMNQADLKPIIFDSAGSLFNKVNINLMLMKNWKKDASNNALDKRIFTNQIQKMISFLNKNNMTAYDLDGEYLEKENWTNWPNTIAWVKTNNLTKS